MKRLLCVIFSLFLLISLLTVSSVADEGEQPATEEQQTEITEVVEDFAEYSEVIEDSGEENQVIEDSEESEEEKVQEETDQEEYIFPETIRLSPEVETAILRIDQNVTFGVYGVIPLIVAFVLCFMFYKWFARTFF